MAAGLLINLAWNDANKVAIVGAGALEPLVQLLRTGNTMWKNRAAMVLRFLGVNAENPVAIAQAGVEPLM
eukprot:95636-Prorocentrum_minimum.AAC.1